MTQNLGGREQVTKKGNNFPVLVEDVRLFWKLRIMTFLKELHKEELSLTLM